MIEGAPIAREQASRIDKRGEKRANRHACILWALRFERQSIQHTHVAKVS